MYIVIEAIVNSCSRCFPSITNAWSWY